MDLAALQNVRLPGGFLIAEVDLAEEPLMDALGRSEVAQTRIVDGVFRLRIRSGLGDWEVSVSLYHEVLEAASVATLHPPHRVVDFNERDFEQAAHDAQDAWGQATPETLRRLLLSYGFEEDLKRD